MIKNKIKYAFKSSFVGLLAGVCVQYIIEVVLKLIKKTNLKEAFKVNGKWQVYYTSAISGGINGFLLPFVPRDLYSFSSILVVVSVYNALMFFSSEDEFINNLQSSNDFVFGIIRDIFLINFIIFIFGKLTKLFSKGDNVKREELPFSELLGVTIISSLVISLSFNFTQSSINSLFLFTNSLDEAITE